MSQRFFITGTDTGIGKTVVSALLCAALNALYWKPIQTGTREGADRSMVIKLAQLARNRALPEAYRFAPPVSPHLAAERARVRIDLRKIKIPRIEPHENLIIEGAGGVLVPINEKQLMVHLMARLNLPVLLVARTSLGTINHTLLSLVALRAASLEIAGVILVGKKNIDNHQAIEHYGKIRIIGFVPPLAQLNRKTLLQTFQKHFDRDAFAVAHE
jgi:dethiobiotin synthetase